MPKAWEWDETLYLGSAPYYVRGRPPYAPGLADALARHLALDGRGRLIDVGCGPGVITLPLAPHFALRVSAGTALVRTADDAVAWVYSLSGSAPHPGFVRRDANVGVVALRISIRSLATPTRS